MGDRANIHIQDGGSEGVYFYTHWRGYELPIMLRHALDRGKDRWNDTQYLSRIIFCEMIQHDVMGLLGYGISSFLGDNSYPIIEVGSNSVTIGHTTWTFNEFTHATDEEIYKAYQYQ